MPLKAHTLGYEAYESGLYLNDNPYDEDDDRAEWSAWSKGWRDAADELGLNAEFRDDYRDPDAAYDDMVQQQIEGRW